MHVLAANRHVRCFGRFQRGRQVNIRRANHDLVAGVAADQRQKIVEELAGLLGCFIHLPIGGNELCSIHSLDPMRNSYGLPDAGLRWSMAAVAKVSNAAWSNSTKQTSTRCRADRRLSTTVGIATQAACSTG